MKNVIISNQEKFDQLIQKFKEQGKDKLHVLADFDRTLTKGFVNGQKTPSIISILRDHNYLTEDYPEKAKALFEKYHPIEINPEIPFAEKKAKMEQWWRTHFELLIKSGINKKDIKSVVESGLLEFRESALDFIKQLKEKNIPLVILSSSGMGKDAIAMLLKKEGVLSDNIKIISNSFEYDEQGNVINIIEPIIHVMNKDETVIKEFPEVFDKVKDRKNVILMGDNIEDLKMITGFEYDNLLRVGFLNDKVEENIENYKNNFDVVITNDGEMGFVNELLNEIL